MNPSDMNNEQLRIAVAEAPGWTNIRPMPDYPCDLNACHEFEEELDEKARKPTTAALCLTSSVSLYE